MDNTTTATTTIYPHPHSLPRNYPHSQSYATRGSRPPPSTPSSRRKSSASNTPAHSAPQHRAPQTANPPDDLSSQPPLHNYTVYPTSTRARSPDVLSRVSASSSVATGGPQLRKKPKTISIQNKPRSKSSGVANAPTLTIPANGHDGRPSSSPAPNPANSSKPLSRADSNNSQQHSPIYKRPPASHSSYGVETTCGPPPSYTTQRTLSQERIKKPDRNTILWVPQQDSSLKDLEYTEDNSNSIVTQKDDTASAIIESSPDTIDTQTFSTSPEMNRMANVTIRGQRTGGSESLEEDSKASSSDERKSEDLFLNIAKVDAARLPAAKTERKRSRISIPFLSSNRIAHESKSSPVHPQSAVEPPSMPQVEEPRYYNKRASLGAHMPGAFSRTNLVDSGRSNRNVEPVPDIDRFDQQYGSKHSNRNPEYARLTQRPSQGLRNQRLATETAYVAQSREGEHIATESTVSTAAPSTVWDELDDLKSRMRKLELTGKLPPSSAAAMSSIERPRTATTAATTMSASPKLKNGGVSLPSAIEGIPSNVHPLLHEALGSAKQVLSQEVYHKLYATASDALQLATMMRLDDQESLSANHEKQVRRRTESMCRGLTELAIALTAESKGTPAVNRPMSRDQQSHPPSAMLRSRRYSNDPADRSAPSRVSSRLESRRTSLVLGPMSPEVGSSDVSGALPPLPGIRLGRASTVARGGGRRGPSYFDGADDESEASPSVRPMSRAMTEGSYRRTSRDPIEVSRELSKENPLPSRTQGFLASNAPYPSTANASFVSRRKYAPSANVVGGVYESSPITPREAWGHISVVPPDQVTPSDIVSEVDRTGSGRRSLGLAGRLGSTVGSRLRAVRADRGGRESLGEGRSTKDITPLKRGDEATMANNRDRMYVDRM